MKWRPQAAVFIAFSAAKGVFHSPFSILHSPLTVLFLTLCHLMIRFFDSLRRWTLIHRLFILAEGQDAALNKLVQSLIDSFG